MSSTPSAQSDNVVEDVLTAWGNHPESDHDDILGIFADIPAGPASQLSSPSQHDVDHADAEAAHLEDNDGATFPDEDTDAQAQIAAVERARNASGEGPSSEPSLPEEERARGRVVITPAFVKAAAKGAATSASRKIAPDISRLRPKQITALIRNQHCRVRQALRILKKDNSLQELNAFDR